MWVWNRIKGQEDMATDRQLRLDELRREASFIHGSALLGTGDQLRPLEMVARGSLQ